MQIDMERIKEAIYRAENGDSAELIEIAKKLYSYDPLAALKPADPRMRITEGYWLVCTKVNDFERDFLTMGKKYKVINEGFPAIYCDNGDRKRLYSIKSTLNVTMSDDPLNALAAVMREHELTIVADGGVIIVSGDNVIVEDQRDAITADDIKPEQ